VAADAREIERTGDPVTVIPQAAREAGARHLVLAAIPPGLLDRLRGSVIERLLVQLPDVDLHILTGSPGRRPPGGDAADAPEAGATSTGATTMGVSAPAAGRRSRAPIRVYLGYARGCGTTTAMLEEARRRQSRGADVVVAAVEARGREEVSVLLEGLEQIGDGTSLDTGAVLGRRPEVVCLDEVSATTTTGESRLAAARRLADAGIAVVATAHLRDGLDEASLLALADEIELVDVAPSALIERVRRGEIVPPEQVEQALATEYAPAELTGRREHAFRIVTEHAERRLAAYRQDDARAAGADARPAILACVAPRPGMEQLIRRSAALAAQVDGEFLAASVADPRPDSEESSLVGAYSGLVAQLGGELTVLPGANPALVLAEFARRQRISVMMLARNAPHPGRYPVLRELTGRAARLELHVLRAEPPG
jgi:two-component system sensor histidine kinase KdpD